MKARIGIMSEKLIRMRLMAIAQRKYIPLTDEPKVWYTSINAISQVLCQENITLLRLIDSERPESLTELATISGRAKSNLSNTLKSLSDKGFVRLEKKAGNTITPIALFTDFEIVISTEIEYRVQQASAVRQVA